MNKETVKREAEPAHRHFTWERHEKSIAHHGLSVLLVPTSVGLMHAMAGYARQACRPTPHRGSPVPTGKRVTILFIGTPQEYHVANQVVHAMPLPDDAAGLTLKHVHNDAELNWFEGIPRLRLEELLSSRTTSRVVVLPCSAAVLAAAPPAAIASLKHFAMQVCKQVVVLAHAVEIAELGHVAALADDTLICDPCEPDPGFQFAWTIESSNARDFHADGLGKLMIQLVVKNDEFGFRASKFVSADRLDRLIWYLAAEGYERAAIANTVNTTIDEVDERSARMRTPNRDHVPKGYRRRFGRVYQLPPHLR